MRDASSYGHGALESRTINVEANLLAARLGERERIVEGSRRRLAVILLTVVAGGLALPPLFRLQNKAKLNALHAQQRVAALAANMTSLSQAQTAVQPKLAIEEMRAYVKLQARTYLGHLFLVMNAVPKSVVLGNLKGELMGGELKITGQADAEDYGAARNFVSNAGEGPNVQDTVLSTTRRSDTLGPAGVSFDFIKRVKTG